MSKGKNVSFSDIQRNAMKGAKMPVTKNKGLIKKLVFLVGGLCILGIWKLVELIISLVGIMLN